MNSFAERVLCRLLLLTMSATASACAGESPDSPGQTRPEQEIPEADPAVAFFLQKWGVDSPFPTGPMTQPLPLAVDTRDWELMRQGYLAHAEKEELAKNRPEAVREPYQKDYKFSWDVFTMNIPLWRAVLEPLAGKPGLRYLEVGISEGRATLWMLENVLTHPTSRAVGIDPFLVPDHEQRLLDNLEKSGAADRIELIKGFSQEALPQLPENSFDVIYIDGSHLAGDVMLDAVYSWRLLKPGGLVIHDDYIWEQRRGLPSELTPWTAVDAFVTALRNTVEVVHRGDQIILRKLPDRLPDFCWNRNPCSRVGDYYYAWTSRTFYKLGTTDVIQLSEAELQTLESILRSRRFGAEANLLLAKDVAALRSQRPEEFKRFADLLRLRIAGGGRQ